MRLRVCRRPRWYVIAMLLLTSGCGVSSKVIDRPYLKVWQATIALYPDPTRPRESDTQWVLTHPAYAYYSTAYSIAVEREELVHHEHYCLTIRNGSKFDWRNTTIELRAEGPSSTRVTVDSKTESYGLLSGATEYGRDWFYQRDRLNEIERFLQGQPSWIPGQ